MSGNQLFTMHQDLKMTSEQALWAHREHDRST